ncbi:acyltransferase family protein [Aeromicrobium sp. 179-A 4D2 NHS]|uniref:acyltransferase family protein n=1 Tax=Aeromicrobium sp. 179-A 4D2 NHS TaxID=3142375 RepID=UPI0039A2B7B2
MDQLDTAPATARREPRAPGSRRRPAAPRPARRLRPEIQGLRAVAVGAVVLYHLGLSSFTGGYVGVDVFFVISGFLITSHIASRVERTGSLGLADFWARRARRLLPASLLVLAVSLVLTRLFVPATLWEQSLRQIVASTFYVQNWALAGDAVDYSAQGNTPTLVQHYWSLSVEEQFYVVWPLLIALALWVARRVARAVPTRTLLTWLIAAVTVASLVWSVVATDADASRAYFDTRTRMWEFGVGALLALAPVRLAAPLGWLGLAAIAWAATTYDHATAFPGYTALVPVLGTALVIGAGGSGSRWSADGLLSVRPATFVGDVSYAVYLWHWPLIVCWPYVLESEIGALDRTAIVVLTLALAWASTRFVEDPLRSGPLLRSGRRTLVASATAMAVIAAAAAGLVWQQGSAIEAARDRAANAGDRACLGPAALDPGADCDLNATLDAVLADPTVVAAENSNPVFPGCQSDLNDPEVDSCRLGDRDADRAIAVVGDSHATHWFGALDAWGRDAGWAVVTYTRSSCPFTTTRRTLPDEPSERYELCGEGNRRILERLEADPDVSLVVTSSYSSAYGWADDEGRDGLDALVPGVREVAERLEAAGKPLAVIRDVPAVKDKKNATDCLARTGSVEACSLPRDEAMTPDLYAEAARDLDLPVIDLTDRFCVEDTCPVVIGDVIVFRDYSHLSSDYSRLLGPALGERLAPLLAD